MTSVRRTFNKALAAALAGAIALAPTFARAGEEKKVSDAVTAKNASTNPTAGMNLKEDYAYHSKKADEARAISADAKAIGFLITTSPTQEAGDEKSKGAYWAKRIELYIQNSGQEAGVVVVAGAHRVQTSLFTVFINGKQFDEDELSKLDAKRLDRVLSAQNGAQTSKALTADKKGADKPTRAASAHNPEIY